MLVLSCDIVKLPKLTNEVGICKTPEKRHYWKVMSFYVEYCRQEMFSDV